MDGNEVTGTEATIVQGGAEIPAAEIPKPAEIPAETPSRIAAMQAKMDAREKQLVGEYAKSHYILEKCGDLPLDIVRQMLPATEDKAALSKAEHLMRASLQGWIRQMMDQGKIKRTPSPCEYSSGGNAPQAAINTNLSAGELLKMRR